MTFSNVINIAHGKAGDAVPWVIEWLAVRGKFCASSKLDSPNSSRHCCFCTLASVSYGCSEDQVSSTIFCVRENSPGLHVLLSAQRACLHWMNCTPCSTAAFYKESEKSPNCPEGCHAASIHREARRRRQRNSPEFSVPQFG